MRLRKSANKANNRVVYSNTKQFFQTHSDAAKTNIASACPKWFALHNAMSLIGQGHDHSVIFQLAGFHFSIKCY